LLKQNRNQKLERMRLDSQNHQF